MSINHKMRKEVKQLLSFAPVDGKWQEFDNLYFSTFKSRNGQSSFIDSCGGKVENALEILKINEAIM